MGPTVGFWPVTVVPVGRLAAATLLWRTKGRLHVTVVVKARFRFQHDGVMTPMMPEPVRPQLGELAPYLGQADVVVVAAQAHSAGAASAPRAVRLALFREWAVVDKSLLVYPGSATSDGVAIVAPQGETAAVVVHPSHPDRVASLAPIGERDPARMALLDDAPLPKPTGGVLEIGDMFPWAFYQVAPPDQRTTYLRGDEWLVLDGMHPTEPRLQSRLPGALAMVRVYPPGLAAGNSYQVAMQADQLSINVDRLACSMLWRGSFAVSDVASARALTLVAAVALPGQPPAWPDHEQLLQSEVMRARFEPNIAVAAAVEATVPQAPAEAYADTDEPKVVAAAGPAKPYDQATLDARAAKVAAQFDHAAVSDATTLLFDEPPPSSTADAVLSISSDGVLSFAPVEQAGADEAADASPEAGIKTEPMPGRFPVGPPNLAMSDAAMSGTVRMPADKAAQIRPKLAQVDVSRLLAARVSSADPPARAAQASGQLAPTSVSPPDLTEAKVDDLEWTLSRSLAQLESEGESDKLTALRRLLAERRNKS